MTHRLPPKERIKIPRQAMPEQEPSTDRPRYCPYCGEPVGWFFGRFTADGGKWV